MNAEAVIPAGQGLRRAVEAQQGFVLTPHTPVGLGGPRCFDGWRGSTLSHIGNAIRGDGPAAFEIAVP